MKLLQVHFKGLFGNQAICYAYCRSLAERLDAELQCDAWCGEELFEDVKSNPIRPSHVDLSISECWFDLAAMEKADVVSVDYFMTLLSKEPVRDGIAGHHVMNFTKTQLRKWFKFKPKYAYESSFQKVFHLRYWDPRVSNMQAIWHSPTVYPCANISLQSYIDAARSFGYDTDGFEIVHDREPHFKAGIPKDLQFCVDFQIMTQASVLFRANSSFSYLAAALGHGEVFSPMMEGVQGAWDKAPQFCSFERGNYGSFWPGALCGQSELGD